ncbi:hypothetical protein JHW43_008115 [Diplocarpon mali]|nr:hypothetical protein JHW43_008115 [Diplocarpon mali]
MSQTSHYTTYSSFSYSSTTSSNGQRTGQAYQHTSHSTSAGTTTYTRSQTLGEPVIHETRRFDEYGRQIDENGRALGSRNTGVVRKVEDVTEDNAGD